MAFWSDGGQIFPHISVAKACDSPWNKASKGPSIVMSVMGLVGCFFFISCSLSVLVNLSFSCGTIFSYSLVGFMAAYKIAFRRV